MCSDCQSNSGNQCCWHRDDGIDPINRNAKLCNSVNESFKRFKDIRTYFHLIMIYDPNHILTRSLITDDT